MRERDIAWDDPRSWYVRSLLKDRTQSTKISGSFSSVSSSYGSISARNSKIGPGMDGAWSRSKSGPSAGAALQRCFPCFPPSRTGDEAAYLVWLRRA